MIKIPDFTNPEINKIKDLANFTVREEQLFNLRANEISHEECAEILNVSPATEYRINRTMLRKIIKVI